MGSTITTALLTSDLVSLVSIADSTPVATTPIVLTPSTIAPALIASTLPLKVFSVVLEVSSSANISQILQARKWPS